MGEGWESSTKRRSFQNRKALNRKTISVFLYLKGFRLLHLCYPSDRIFTCSKEHSGSIKGDNFFNQLSDC